MSKLEERIAAAEERLKALKARHVRAATKQRARDAKQKRRDDVRRQMLVGAVVLDLVERGEIEVSQLARWLNGRLSGKEDLELFDHYWDLPGDLLSKSQGGTEGNSALR
jgi:large subunit ribosomal protein L7/L12